MAAPQVPPPPSLLLLLLLLSCSSFLLSESKLSLEYYSKSCPPFARIVRRTVADHQAAKPNTASGMLRLFLHDCLITGCDASVLLSSTKPSEPAERNADLNLSLREEAFGIVASAKAALELACPGTMSCTDILATATRDLVTTVGGPSYEVRLGRKDGTISRASLVEGNQPMPNMTVSTLINIFGSRGFSIQEMVALSGSHTIGFAHCKEFSAGIFNYSQHSQYDPRMYNPSFAQALERACADYKIDPTLSVVNDVRTPHRFDNLYYRNLPKGYGVLASDHALYGDPRTRPFVAMYAADQNTFFQDFAAAMEKPGAYGVKTGRRGEIRGRCDAVNKPM